MLRLVYAALNVKPEEQERALLLLGFGFFMGIFLATFQLCFSPDSKEVLTVSADKTAKIWNVESKEVVV